jgi:hypothetical protein
MERYEPRSTCSYCDTLACRNCVVRWGARQRGEFFACCRNCYDRFTPQQRIDEGIPEWDAYHRRAEHQLAVRKAHAEREAKAKARESRARESIAERGATGPLVSKWSVRSAPCVTLTIEASVPIPGKSATLDGSEVAEFLAQHGFAPTSLRVTIEED